MEDFITASLKAVGLEIDISTLKNLFDSIGVEVPADASLVCEADLASLLKPIQARKLMKHWREMTESSTRFVHFLYIFL